MVKPTKEHRTSEADPLDILRRWEQAGGVWRVTQWSADAAVVALMRCDAGEVVDEVSSTGPAFVDYLAQHPSSDIS